MKKQEDIILGNRIKEIRIKLNYDQKRFAQEIGATVSALSNWENGRNKPNMEKLSKIANLGNTTVEALISNSKKEYALKYALERLKEILFQQPYIDIDVENSDFVYKYGGKILSIIEKQIEFLKLTIYSNKDIENFVDEIIDRHVYTTPKNTRGLLFDIKLTLSDEVRKISDYSGETNNLPFYLNISDNLDSKITTEAKNILNNAIEEIETLINNCD